MRYSSIKSSHKFDCLPTQLGTGILVPEVTAHFGEETSWKLSASLLEASIARFCPLDSLTINGGVSTWRLKMKNIIGYSSIFMQINFLTEDECTNSINDFDR